MPTPVDLEDIGDYFEMEGLISSIKARRRAERDAFVQKMVEEWNKPSRRFARWWADAVGEEVTTFEHFMKNVNALAKKGWPDV